MSVSRAKSKCRGWGVLLACVLLAMLFGTAAGVEAGPGKGGGKPSRPDDPKDDGGQHGGPGATMVPVVDEDFRFMVTWTRNQIRADEAHQHATGAGVTVAVLDGGFNLDHPWLSRNLSPLAYDAVDQDFDPQDLGNGLDDDGDGYPDLGVGHGTFVAGMVLLAAPDATILPIRVHDDEGYGSNAELLRGLQYAWDAGADVVNISLSRAAWHGNDVERKIRRMFRAGIAFVASAGNDGVDQFTELANMEQTLAVGSTNEADWRAPFSNHDERSFSPAVFAPGMDLYGPLGAPEDDSSGYWSGTSFSAGLVSGAVALVLERRPRIDLWDLYWWHINDTADPVRDFDGSVLPWTGRLNLLRAVEAR